MSIADKLTTIAENQEKIYDKGCVEGRNAMISRSLKTIDDKDLTRVGNYAFAGMSLASMNLPNVTYVGKYAFKGVQPLSEIDLPNLMWLGGKGDCTFSNCAYATRYNLPKLRTDSTQSTYSELRQTFAHNYVLARLELKNDIAIGIQCFYDCPKLETLVLGDNATLNSTSAFDDTPIKNGTGYIYVPDDKVDAYKTATNWVTFASRIKGYSELPIWFFVNNTMYQVPLGSTWNDFLVSEHNDGTFAVSSYDNVTVVRRHGSAYYTLSLNGNYVYSTDLIQPEQKYRVYGT